MPKTTKTSLPWTTVYTSSTTGHFIPATGWLAAGPFEKLRITSELAALGLNVSVQPAYQVANVENTVVSTTTIQSPATSNGMAFAAGWTDIGATTDDNQLVRFGWEVKLTSGSSFAGAMVAGTLERVEG